MNEILSRFEKFFAVFKSNREFLDNKDFIPIKNQIAIIKKCYVQVYQAEGQNSLR